MIDAATLTGRVDHDDRFVDGDAAFTALNARAGGATGKLLATPQLATVARLARRLGILVSRRLTIADGDADLECWVRARPVAGGVTITLADVHERVPSRRQPMRGDVVAPPGGDWTWETDASLRIRYVSVEAGARYGFDAAVALGQPLTRLFNLEAGETGVLPLLEALAARRDFDDQEAMLREAGRPVRLAASVRSDAANGFAGFVGTTFMQAGTAAAVEPALSAAFSSRLDRALRGPLGRIIANADSLNAESEGPLSPHYVDYAADIASAGRHLMGLVDDLVDLEAIERDDFAVDAERMDVADVARRAAGLLAVRAADGGVTIDRPSFDDIAHATGEFRRTLQILVNLIGNAVRYSPRGGTVSVTVARDGTRVATIVADQGKGIAIADQARIFEKFERVDPGEPGGSGLGLYIARRLARAMGGELTVDSEPGKGARFVFTLPSG